METRDFSFEEAYETLQAARDAINAHHQRVSVLGNRIKYMIEERDEHLHTIRNLVSVLDDHLHHECGHLDVAKTLLKQAEQQKSREEAMLAQLTKVVA